MFENRELHYRDEGREYPETLVLLHGFLQNLNVWSSFTLTYMRKMRVISIDLPGHGYSATYSDVHSMDFMANAVKAVLFKERKGLLEDLAYLPKDWFDPNISACSVSAVI